MPASNPYWLGGAGGVLGYGYAAKPERKPREEFMFGTEPITGYRLWKVGKVPHNSLKDFLTLLADAHDAGADNPYRWALGQIDKSLLLSVAGSGSVWVPHVAEAVCLHGSHPAPALSCECGFWALRDEETLAQAWNYQPDAWGTVKLWGRYCEFEKGYRAQYAYPEKVTLLRKDPALAAELAQTYRVEVVCGEHPEAFLKTVSNYESSYQAALMKYQAASAMWIPQLYGGPQAAPKKWWQKP